MPPSLQAFDQSDQRLRAAKGWCFDLCDTALLIYAGWALQGQYCDHRTFQVQNPEFGYGSGAAVEALRPLCRKCNGSVIENGADLAR